MTSLGSISSGCLNSKGFPNKILLLFGIAFFIFSFAVFWIAFPVLQWSLWASQCRHYLESGIRPMDAGLRQWTNDGSPLRSAGASESHSSNGRREFSLPPELTTTGSAGSDCLNAKEVAQFSISGWLTILLTFTKAACRAKGHRDLDTQ